MNLQEIIPGMSVRARVRMGACELDVVRPGWFRSIDVESLELSSECNCVLAQLDEGDYQTGCREVFGVEGMNTGVDSLSFTLVAGSGFVAFTNRESVESYDEMTTYWKQEIRARKRAAQAVKDFKKLAVNQP